PPDRGLFLQAPGDGSLRWRGLALPLDGHLRRRHLASSLSPRLRSWVRLRALGLAITKITDHVEQAILRLPIQFRRNWRDNLRPANVGPTASFSFVTSGLEVTFTDLSSDSDGLIVAWSWNFGDGNTSTSQNP